MVHLNQFLKVMAVMACSFIFSSLAQAQTSPLKPACFRLEGARMECVGGGGGAGACPTAEVCKKAFCPTNELITGNVPVYTSGTPGSCVKTEITCTVASKVGDGCDCDCGVSGGSCKATTNGLCKSCTCNQGEQCAEYGGGSAGTCTLKKDVKCYKQGEVPMVPNGNCGCACPAGSGGGAYPTCGSC